MSRPSAAVINRYQNKVYDRLNVIIPKGRKNDVESYCSANGFSVSGLVNDLLRDRLGMSESEWKTRPTAPLGEE